MSELDTEQQDVMVIGHRNPDTDSICSAIAYAELMNLEGGARYIACRNGELNPETRFALRRFGFAEPLLCEDVSPRVRDCAIRRVKGVSENMSIRKAWEVMRDRDLSALPITAPDRSLKGIISLKDLATAYLDNNDAKMLSRSHTAFGSIAETLRGEVVSGDPQVCLETGRVLIGAGNTSAIKASMEEGDLVIVSNRCEAQKTAIEMGAACIVVCMGYDIEESILSLAVERGCTVISTPYDTYMAANFIQQSVPIGYCMTTENLLTFSLNTLLEDVKKTMGKVRFVYFPVLDESGKYYGLISKRNVMNFRKKQLFLVDHNEKGQCVEGIEESEIIGIIDHHRVGNLETNAPVYFRNQPVGSTATILYELYGENAREIRPEIAGLLCCGILSDTLGFRSPTSTDLDRRVADTLASLAGIDLREFEDELFAAGEDIGGISADKLLERDFKALSIGELRLGISQAEFMSESRRADAIALALPALEQYRLINGLSIFFFMLTDISNKTSYILFTGPGAEELLEDAFRAKPKDGILILKGVVSRKKQFVPAILEAVSRI